MGQDRTGRCGDATYHSGRQGHRAASQEDDGAVRLAGGFGEGRQTVPTGRGRRGAADIPDDQRPRKPGSSRSKATTAGEGRDAQA